MVTSNLFMSILNCFVWYTNKQFNILNPFTTIYLFSGETKSVCNITHQFSSKSNQLCLLRNYWALLFIYEKPIYVHLSGEFNIVQQDLQHFCWFWEYFQWFFVYCRILFVMMYFLIISYLVCSTCKFHTLYASFFF